MPTPSPESVLIDLDKIVLPDDTRPHSPQHIDDLIKDMNDNGQLKEIVVVPVGDKYEVVAGVGRVLAARRMCWDRIRGIVRTGLSEFEKLHMTFSENEAGGNPPAVFQARLLRKMIEAEQLNQASLAERIGKPASLINQYLALTELEQEVEEKFSPLKLFQATEILRLPNSRDQIEVARRCAEKDLSRQELQTIVAWKLAGAARKGSGPAAAAVRQPVTETIPLSHADPLQARNHFAWRGSKLELYPRPFIALKEELTAYMGQLRSDMLTFMNQHPAKATEIESGDFAAKLQIVADPADRATDSK